MLPPDALFDAHYRKQTPRCRCTAVAIAISTMGPAGITVGLRYTCDSRRSGVGRRVLGRGMTRRGLEQLRDPMAEWVCRSIFSF